MNGESKLQNLLAIYNKVLIVDFSCGEYRSWKVPPDEVGRPITKKIDDYWNWFIGSGLLNPKDVAGFREFVKHPLLSRHYCYGRLVGGSWRQMLMEIFANDDGATHVLCVRDITDIYAVESDKIKSVDEMTGVLNRYALKRDIAAYRGGNICVMFLDVNGLKYINDSQGHRAGDALILRLVEKLNDRFSDCKIYRRGGDEFMVLATDVKLRHFASRARAFHKELWRSDGEFPLAAMGYSVDVECIGEVIQQAEDAMYYDKRMFQKFYPQYKR